MASLSGTEAPRLGDGPRLSVLPLVCGFCALASVMFVWKLVKESVGGAAMANAAQLLSWFTNVNRQPLGVLLEDLFIPFLMSN